MRSLSSTLLAAQKESSHIPLVKVEAYNTISGVVRLQWTRLYTGSEDDYFHAVAMPGDGSLIRLRMTPPSDSRKLYYQRVTNPDADSNYSSWTYLGIYNVVIVASCDQDAKVSQFYIKNTRAIYHRESTDNGASWGSWSLLGYTPTTAIYGIAAAYKSNGDIALFYADQATLYVKKRLSGSWGSATAWDKSTGDLSGIATVYDSDWNLLLTGKDSGGNYKLWSFIYGDGGDVSAGTWSDLKEIASAESSAGFQYLRPFLDKPALGGKPDVYRAFFVDKFTGVEAYSRPFWTHSIPTTTFLLNLWREPVPFNLASDYGLAIAHYDDYCWLSNPSGVWRAKLTQESIDLTEDILALREETGENSGKLIVEMRNDSGQYASPGQGDLSLLDIGGDLHFSPGYRTTVGDEVSSGQTFIIEAYEHTSSGGKASLILYAWDGWTRLGEWIARHQFRWNKASSEMSIKQILQFILARVGLKLEVESQSSVITSYYPDFTIHPNNRGDTIVRKLLSFVPDVIMIEGNKAYIVNPLSSDSSVYSYGSDHPILEGRYRVGAWELNRIQVEGYDPASDVPIVVDSFAWNEINKLYDRLRQVEDRNIDTADQTQARGEACLRQSEIESASGSIRIPVNCGQQLYDVIDITDSRAGLSADKKRVLGLILVYQPSRGLYELRLILGAV